MKTETSTLERLIPLVAETLGIEPDEVTAEALFEADLGGESLDFLDLGFRCEREFRVRVRFQDLDMKDLPVNTDGTLTEEALLRIAKKFPQLDVARWRGRSFKHPMDLLTVGDLAAIVEAAIAAGQPR